MNQHHLADLPNSVLSNLGDPLGGAGLFNSLINFEAVLFSFWNETTTKNLVDIVLSIRFLVIGLSNE